MHPHSILIVEDDELLLQHFASILKAHRSFSEVFVCNNFSCAVRLLIKQRPDILLVDLDLPDGSGIDLIKQITEQQLPTEAMVISVFGDERHVINAIEAGASGYILKDETGEDIINALLQLIDGGAPISPAIATHLLRQFRVEKPKDQSINKKPSPLSERETAVIKQVSMGYTSAEIAENLEISAHTVNTHIKNIYSKLAVNNRVAAVNRAIADGLIND